MSDAAQMRREELARAVSSAREQSLAGAGSVLDELFRSSAVQPTELVRALRELAGVEVILQADEAVPDYSRLSKDQAAKDRCVALAGRPLRLAAEDPWNEVVIRTSARLLGEHPVAVAVPRAVLEQWLGDARGIAPLSHRLDSQATGPIVDFVDQALRSAYSQGASDAHFECDREGATAKLRLDGVLRPFARIDGVQQAQEVISRIKVMAQLDITERRLPQDGRTRFVMSNAEVDLRVSIMPSVHGEDAVLRLLDKSRLKSHSEVLSLASLGFAAAELESLRYLSTMPSGMLLVTGPTGSGKTTTIYAALSEINSGEEKVVTIEDPVEYEIAGVLQIPVNERKGLTFAKGLRSILRHDPDRILVGEIRDAETAEIAVQSALTGHLVFTTVHANSLPDVVGRFRHFGLDMFGLMSSLNGVVVQRLLRQLCSSCKGSRAPTVEEQNWLARMGHDPVAHAPRAMGCTQCRGTGYAGRFVISEVHCIQDALRDAVTEGAPLSALKALAAAQGVTSLAPRAAEQVLQGRTTLEEVRRVVGFG